MLRERPTTELILTDFFKSMLLSNKKKSFISVSKNGKSYVKINGITILKDRIEFSYNEDNLMSFEFGRVNFNADESVMLIFDKGWKFKIELTIGENK